MKASKIAYKTLDRLYAATENTDRANRGVKMQAWIMAAVFSGSFYAAVYFIVNFFKG